MALITRNPFALINELQRDVSRLFDNRLYPNYESASLNSADWVPAVDIHEDADNFFVSVDLPGIKPDDIDVTAHNGVLSIRGKREAVNEDKQQKRVERIFGSFVREFSMPESADLDRVQAKTENGVLNIVVPKVAKVEPKRITVQ
jgi:HSP20 family protein